MPLMTGFIAQAKRYDFLQVVRILRVLNPDYVINLHAEPWPDGYSHEVQGIKHEASGYSVVLKMQGISGVESVLPDYLHEAVLDSMHQDSQALSDFFDLFNHRFFQINQRVLEQNNLLLQDEQEQLRTPSQGRVSQRKALTKLSALPSQRGTAAELIQYTTLIGLRTRSLSGLKQLLEDYFELSVRVQVTESSKHRLPFSSLTRLGGGARTNSQLGRGFLLGKIGTLHLKGLEILIEPQNQDEFLRLKDDAEFTRCLREVCNTYLRESNDVRLYLFVRRALISEPQLSADDRYAVRLGEANCLAPKTHPNEYRKILLT